MGGVVCKKEIILLPPKGGRAEVHAGLCASLGNCVSPLFSMYVGTHTSLPVGLDTLAETQWGPGEKE